MAGSASDYLENKILDLYLGGQASGAVGTLYIGLFTVAPTDAGGGTEVSGNNYSRKSVTANQTNFPAASGGSISLNVAQTFATPSGDWGTIVAFGIFDAASAGNLLYWGDLTVSKPVYSGDPPTFPVGSITISQT